MSQNYFYVEYNVKTDNLETWEIHVLSNFKEISKKIAIIYSKQRNSDYPGANFYPHDATKEEILEASKGNPDILDKYTIVKRDESGKLYAVPYYKEYKDEINSICEYLKESAKLYSNNGKGEYAKYLDQLAKDFKSKDGFLKSSILWLKIEDRNCVDIKVGPIETYLDKLFAIKRAYQSNVRIENKDESSHIEQLVNVVNALQPNLPFGEDGGLKLNVRMDYVVAMAGWHAELIPRGSNYPVDPQIIRDERVAKILIYSNNVEKRDGMLFDGVLPTLFGKDLLGDLDRKDFMRNWLRFIIHHELTEELAKYRYISYEDRLGAYSEVVRELYSTLMGIKAASVQVLKGGLTVKDYRYLLIELILVAFRDWVISVNGNSGLRSYSDGYVWCVNYLISEKALNLDEKKGVLSIDFSRVYIGIDNLTVILDNLMRNGYEQDVSLDLKKYSDTSIFERFRTQIEKIIETS